MATPTIEEHDLDIKNNCPWCGGAPEIISTCGGSDGYNVYVRCKICHAFNPFGKVFVPWDYKEGDDTVAMKKAIKNWEKRK